MNTLARTILHARHREGLAQLLRHAGTGAAAGAGLGVVIIALVRGLGASDVRTGALAMGACVLAGGLIGAGVAWSRRWSASRAARELDTRLGTGDVLASGWQWAQRIDERLVPEGRVLAQMTVDAAHRLAGEIDVRRAVPVRIPRRWGAAAGVLLLGAGMLAWTPVGFFEPVGRRVLAMIGRQPTAPAPSLGEMLARVQRAKEVVSQLAQREPEAPDLHAVAVLDQIERELREGKTTPREAREASASALSAAADRAEQLARERDEARSALLERLALAARGQPGEEGSELSRALARGDLEAAHEQAQQLARSAQSMSPREQERAASELAQLVQQLATEPPRLAPGDHATESMRRAGLSEDQAREVAQSASSRQAEEKLRQQGVPHEKAQQIAEELGESRQRERAQEQAQSTVQRLRERLQQAAQGLRSSAQQNPPNPPAQPTQTSRERANTNDQPQPSREAGTAKPQPDRPDASPSPAANSPKPQDRGGSKPAPTPQPAPDRPGSDEDATRRSQPSKAQDPRPRDARTPAGDQLERGKKQSDRTGESQTRREPGPSKAPPAPDQRAQDQAPQQPASEPAASTPGGSPLERLRDQLKEMARSPGESRRSEQGAQALRQQAQRLWDRVPTPNNEQAQAQARSGAQERSIRGESSTEPSTPPTGQTGEGSMTARGMSPTGGSGSDARSGEAPGYEGVQVIDKPVRDDAAASTGPERVVAEWLGDGRPGTGAPPAQRGEIIRQAVRAGERAVEDRSTPSRFDRLIKDYFRRLPQALGENAGEPGGGEGAGTPPGGSAP